MGLYKKIMDMYFNEIYLEYIEEMPSLPTKDVINKQLITLLNAIEGQEILKYQIRRLHKDKIVFSDDGVNKEAYRQDGTLLYKGKGSLADFNGWRETKHYTGGFKNGMRDGSGEERCSSLF